MNTCFKEFKPNEFIFKEGESGSHAYIIEEGQVEIYVDQKDGKKIICVLGPGEIFGEMAIIDDAKRSATALAVGCVKLTSISKDQLIERLKKSDPTISFLVTILLNRIRSNLKTISCNDELKKHLHELDKTKEEETAFVEKMKFENELLFALEQDQFTMYLQPIISIKDESIVGFESLIRWNSPKRGFVRPDIFMGLAEETSFIIPLGQWVIRRACREFKKLERSLKSKKNLFVSINVSGKQLQDEKFFDVLEETIRQENIKPSQIKLEVTESILVEGDTVVTWLKECKKRGVSVALDDFGTGYSSLSYLSKLPFDNIKIDKSFTQSINVDDKSKVIVKSIIQMAKGLKIPVIAEGIETKEQYYLLKRLGCDFGQGFLYSKPVCVEDAIDLINNYGKSA